MKKSLFNFVWALLVVAAPAMAQVDAQSTTRVDTIENCFTITVPRAWAKEYEVNRGQQDWYWKGVVAGDSTWLRIHLGEQDFPAPLQDTAVSRYDVDTLTIDGYPATLIVPKVGQYTIATTLHFQSVCGGQHLRLYAIGQYSLRVAEVVKILKTVHFIKS